MVTATKHGHFYVHELVSPTVYNDRGDRAIELIDARVIRVLNLLRDCLGPTTVNNWYWGGDRQYSGLRMPGEPYYSKYSQHSFGRAADCLFRDVTAQEARDYILRNRAVFPHIRFIEDDVSWLHFDVRNNQRLTTWSPVTKKTKVY